MTNQDLFNAEYLRHREAGDDPVMARLRLMEQGASPETARAAQAEAGETDDTDEDEGGRE